MHCMMIIVCQLGSRSSVYMHLLLSIKMEMCHDCLPPSFGNFEGSLFCLPLILLLLLLLLLPLIPDASTLSLMKILCWPLLLSTDQIIIMLISDWSRCQVYTWSATGVSTHIIFSLCHSTSCVSTLVYVRGIKQNCVIILSWAKKGIILIFTPVVWILLSHVLKQIAFELYMLECNVMLCCMWTFWVWTWESRSLLYV